MQTKLGKLNWTPGISQKVAALLMVPLAIQVVLFIVLFALLDRTQKLEHLEAEQSSLVEGLDTLMIDRANAWGSFVTQILFDTKNNTLSADAYKDRFERDYLRIKKLSTVNSAVMETIDDLRQTSAEEYNLLKDIENLPPDNDPTTNKLVKLKMLRPALKTFRKRVNELMKQLEQESRKVTQIRDRENASRSQIRTQLSVSIGLDVLLALAMLFFFMRNLNSRLSKLIENAKAVPAADNLPYKISGTDELSYLDLILHTAVNDLQAAKRHRAAVTAMVAHDLRTPLMSVRLVADGLSSAPEVTGSEPLRKKVKSLNVNIRRVFSLVEDLLTIERLEAGKFELKLELVELGALVDEAFQTVEEAAQAKSVALLNEISACEIVADKDRITQVLLNYLSNAIKFSPENGKIIVTAIVETKCLIVRVSDLGKGIADEDKERLFTKFYQTAEGKSHRGFGLGLAICKLLIAEHGGDVGVESKIGAGSTFWFSLPNEEDY